MTHHVFLSVFLMTALTGDFVLWLSGNVIVATFPCEKNSIIKLDA